MTSRLIGAPALRARRQLVLQRHGQTAWNAESRAQGQADVPLDDEGQRQAETAAARLAVLQPALVWSSDLARARQTAELLAQRTGVALHLDPRLREYDIGIRQGLTFHEFAERYPEQHTRRVAGESFEGSGESEAEVEQRMLAAINAAIGALSVGDCGVIVSHGAALRTAIRAFFGGGDEHGEMFAGMANCAWTLLVDREGSGWQIAAYNATSLPESVQVNADELASRALGV